MPVSHYAAALAKWLSRGRPRRSPEEVRRIYTEVCTLCEYISESGRTCKLCGCRLGLSPNATTNKIVMATESCPVGKW